MPRGARVAPGARCGIGWHGRLVRPCWDTTDLDRERDHNEVNETTDISETTGPEWVDPVHERAGNMTTMPYPDGPTDEMTCTFDAWNRLVAVECDNEEDF